MLASAPRLVEAAALNVEYSTFKQDRSRFSGAGFRDITFAVLFWVHLLAFCGYMGYRTAGIMQDTQKLPKFDAGAYVLVMSMSVGFGAVLAFVWLCLIRIMPKTIIYLSIALLGLLQLVICVLCFLSGQVLGGVLGGLGVLMLLVYVWVMRDSIELTAALMSATVGISKKYPGVLVISVIGLFMSILIFAFYAVTITALAHDVEDKDGKQQKGNLLLRVGAMFSLYWTTNVVAYVVHTTICGVVGRWYFVPEHTSATSPALKQSMSTSFGPIALGSLILAIIQTLKLLAQLAKEDAEEDGNSCTAIAFCVLKCILDCIQSAVEFISNFAFVYVALYGTSFCEGAKHTFELLQESGADAIVSYDMSGIVSFIGSLIGAGLNGLAAWALLRFGGKHVLPESSKATSDDSFQPICIFFAAAIGYVMIQMVSAFVGSGCSTLVVCFAEQPEVLVQTHPELAGQMKAIVDQRVRDE
eukprot:TRINITY_DN9246_c0_g1_i2.p1 TRINITY_DN9246_c0_g1~~TRINITY_DN9246_c0_g1_i2.p1  ORF type:complete len:471 (-),score=48.77 TRINITY_DN9246_c0_g1_i2:21-1433(-)